MLIKGHADLSLQTPGCHPGAPVKSAEFTLQGDVTTLYPYINAVGEEAVYYEKPHYVQFTLDGIRCALYPEKVAAGMFENQAQALVFVERLIRYLNELYEGRDSIEPDHTRYKPISVFEILKLLPKTNCRECGSPTCMAFAAALSKGESTLDRCPGLNDPESESARKIQSLFL